MVVTDEAETPVLIGTPPETSTIEGVRDVDQS